MQLTADAAVLARAKSGDQAAFNGMLKPLQPALRGLLIKMLGDLAEVDDLLQQTMLKAWQSLRSFRGDAKFSTWVHSIAVRQAIDHLRAQKRYREGALLHAANDCVTSGKVANVLSTLAAPDFHFDVHEHIRYCFSCVGRSLEPEQQAALVLRDVYALSNDEAAATLGVTRSVLRHLLGEARKSMMERYDQLCSLVSKQGVCYQCEGLRAGAPAGQRGAEPSAMFVAGEGREAHLKRRLRVVADADGSRSRRLHRLLAQQLHELEQRTPSHDQAERYPASIGECSPAGADGCLPAPAEECGAPEQPCEHV